ncbi:MAG: hypothetical protein AAB308_09410 [Nitrospirota bacterium]|jgi:hypothetical protein
MPKDEMVYVGHMLDKAHEALSLAHAKTRQDYNEDLALRLALTHLIQVLARPLAGFRHSSASDTHIFPGMPSRG